jgi:5'-3' exonuclease
MKNNIMLVDLGGMFYRLYYRFEKTDLNILDEMKRSFIEEIIFLKKRYYINKIFIGGEGSRKTNWRLDIYSDYKSNRNVEITPENEKKMECLKNTKTEFYQWVNHLEKFNMHIISEDRCEGDDILASIILNKTSDDMFYIMSDDKDFQQLIKRDNVMQISLREFQTLVKTEYSDLRCHIAIGDTSDGIPNIKRGYGEKKITALIEKGEFESFIQSNNLTEAYERNRKLIDMTLIPQAYQESITLKFNEKYNLKESINIIEISEELYKLGITTISPMEFIK